MTFLDGIEAGLPYEKALAEGRTNHCHELDKKALQLLFKRKLTISQIARGFAVVENYVIDRCRSCGIKISSIPEAIRTEKRKMNMLEAILYGIGFEKAATEFAPASLKETPSGEILQLLRQGVTHSELEVIFNEPIREIIQAAGSEAEISTASEETFPEAEKKDVRTQVLERVREGKSAKEIHEELGIKHPGALWMIRKARKQLGIQPQAEKPTSEAPKETPAPTSPELEEDLIWQSEIRKTCRSFVDPHIIRVRKHEIAFSRHLTFSPERCDLGVSVDGKRIVLKKSPKGNRLCKANRVSWKVVSSALSRELQDRKISLASGYRIVYDSAEMLIGEAVSPS